MTSLNQNELEVLRILWDHGELKPAQIQSHFSRPIENATLRSVLFNLVEKDHISRRLQGKAFFYASKVPKATMLQNMAAMLAHVFTGGSATDLVVQLIKSSDIKESDLTLLKKAASQSPAVKQKRKT